MRLAALMYWLLATNMVAYNAFHWIRGTPVQITLLMVFAVATYVLIGVQLWQRRRKWLMIGLIPGVLTTFITVVAALGLLPVVWPDVVAGRISAAEIVFPFIVPTICSSVAVIALIGQWVKERVQARPANPSASSVT